MIKEIYLAGGCFWGIEKYISMIPGVKSTETGYANGNTETPSYEDVCYGGTNHAETVKAEYDDSEISLDTLLQKFFEVIDSCTGKVELVTGEGDRLNLKSKLSQYVSMANIFSNGEIPELEIIAYEKEDIDKLVAFMING